MKFGNFSSSPTSATFLTDKPQ